MNQEYVPAPGERRIVIDASLCPPGCDCMPVRMCPGGALHRAEGELSPTVNHRNCVLCGGCVRVCPPHAISIQRE